MNRHILLIGILLIIFGPSCGSNNQSEQSLVNIDKWTTPEYVFFDTSNPAYCHMIAGENLEEFLFKNAGKEEAIRNKIISWNDFYSNQERYLKDCQIRNDYPSFNLENEVAKIIVSNDGFMFSITWNGGLAVTYLDHRHAEKIYDLYQVNRESYLKMEKGTLGDPTYPGHWLYALLENYRQGPEAQPTKDEETFEELKQAAE